MILSGRLAFFASGGVFVAQIWSLWGSESSGWPTWPLSTKSQVPIPREGEFVA